MASRVIGYVRVSTTEQAVHGQGLIVQEQAIRAWSTAQHHKLVALYRDEGLSGSNGIDTREGLAAALAALEGGTANVLVVYRYDRLARDLVLQETLIQRLAKVGAVVVSVTEPEVDADDHTRTLVRQVLGAISQYERAVIRARMAAGKAAKGAAGGYTGGAPPLGYRSVGGQLVADDDGQVVLERIRELHGQGASLRTISAALTAEGHRTKRGGQWHPETLRKIISRL